MAIGVEEVDTSSATAVVDLHIVADAIALGADDYIKKPCDPDDLKSKIQQVMERGEHTPQTTTASMQQI